jgi:hypothetical protein
LLFFIRPTDEGAFFFFLFSFKKMFVMKYYIIQENDELKIIKVKPEQEEMFLDEYKGKILCSGDSMAEALQNFGKLNHESGQ